MRLEEPVGKAIADGERLAGKGIYLRLVEMADCDERYLSWLLDPEVNRYLETRWTEQTPAAIEEFVGGMRRSPDSYLFAIMIAETERHVGNIKLGPINRVHQNCDVSYFIGDRELWRTGLATEAIRAATQFGFDRLGLHRIQAVVHSDNAGSARALERVGYVREGILREKLRVDAGRNDQLVYGILSSELRRVVEENSSR